MDTEKSKKKVLEFGPVHKVVFDGKWFFVIFFALILVCSAFAVLASYTYLEWKQFQSQVQAKLESESSSSKLVIGTNIKSFEQRIGDLEKIMEPFSALDPQSSLTKAIAMTNTEIAEKNEGRLVAMEERITSLTDELNLAKARVENSTKREILIVSMMNLKQKVNLSQPYVTEWDIAATAAQGDQTVLDNLHIIKSNAETGVHSINQLRYDFAKIAGSIIKFEKEPESDENIVKKIFINISRAVTVRKIGGDVEGDSIEAIVARTEHNLELGNLKEAVEELNKIKKTNYKLDEWMKQANILLQTEIAFANIVQHITGTSAEKIGKDTEVPPTGTNS